MKEWGYVFLYGLLTIEVVLLMLTLGSLLRQDKKEVDGMSLLMLVIHGILALFVGVNLAITKKIPQFVQYIGFFVNTGFILSIFTINSGVTSIIMNEKMRTLQFYLLSIYYIVISSLVNIKFVRDLVVRVLAFTCVTVIHFTGREKEEIHSLFSAIAACVFFLVIMETINYINCKAKAKLFLRMACTKFQER